MKRLLYGVFLCFAFSSAFGQSIWEVSPLSPDNSPLKWENSPLNWDNSIVSSKNNGVYDGMGQRVGYVTNTPSGGANVYLNNGHRVGYMPAPEYRPRLELDYPEREGGLVRSRPSTIDALAEPERRARRYDLDDDDDYMPVRRVAVRSGFTPLAQPRGRFTPIEEVEPVVQVRGRFTPIEQYEPVRSGFTPIETAPRGRFTPLK